MEENGPNSFISIALSRKLKLNFTKQLLKRCAFQESPDQIQEIDIETRISLCLTFLKTGSSIHLLNYTSNLIKLVSCSPCCPIDQVLADPSLLVGVAIEHICTSR